MGKSSDGGSSTQTVKSELSPEQRQIMQGTMNTYMPGGTIDSKPQFSQDQVKQAGQNKVAGFNSDQTAAMDATRTNAFKHQPAMGEAMDLTRQSAQPTGQKQGLGTGWSTNADGSAQYADFNSDSMKTFMQPYQDNVIGTGMKEIARAHDLQQLNVNDAAQKAGAFGGSRHGVQNAETTRGFADMGQKFLADTLDRGYSQALGQYNTERNEGQEALSFNNQIDAANAQRRASAGQQLSSQAGQLQEMDAMGSNALGGVGDMQQEQDQMVLDAGYNDLMDNYLWQAKMGQMLSGFTPPPTQTSTTRQKTGGSIWGSVGSAALGSLGNAAMTAFMSDEDLKEDIEEADPEDALASFRKLANSGKGLSKYKYTEEAQAMGAPAGERTGFMAQDYEKATGQENPRHESGHQMVDIPEIIGRLTHAITALDKKVSELERV